MVFYTWFVVDDLDAQFIYSRIQCIRRMLGRRYRNEYYFETTTINELNDGRILVEFSVEKTFICA
jgi:hypothetical protein